MWASERLVMGRGGTGASKQFDFFFYLHVVNKSHKSNKNIKIKASLQWPVMFENQHDATVTCWEGVPQKVKEVELKL